MVVKSKTQLYCDNFLAHGDLEIKKNCAKLKIGLLWLNKEFIIKKLGFHGNGLELFLRAKLEVKRIDKYSTDNFQ